MHRWNRSSWFCARNAIWITTLIQLRMWNVNTGIAHTQGTTQTTQLDILGVMPSKKKGKLRFLLPRVTACVRRHRKSMFCTRSEARDPDGGLLCTTTQPCQDPVLKVLFLVLRRMHDIGHARHPRMRNRREATGTKHLRCRLCCARRLPTSRICSSIQPKHSVSFVCHVVSAGLQSGVFAT